MFNVRNTMCMTLLGALGGETRFPGGRRDSGDILFGYVIPLVVVYV